MKFVISDSYILKRKRGPIICAIWGLLIGSIFFFSQDIPLPLAFVMMLSILALTAGANWRGLKLFLVNVNQHYVEVKDSTLEICGEAYKSVIDLNQVTELVLNKKGNKVKSIVLRREKEYLAKLEHYADIDELAAELMRFIPENKFRAKRWLHS